MCIKHIILKCYYDPITRGFLHKLKIKLRLKEVKQLARGHNLARAKSLDFYLGEVPSKPKLVLQLSLAVFILCR